MKIFFLALIACVVFCYQCESVEVECKYSVREGFYYCFVQNAELITLKNDRDISSIRGQHLDGKSDSDVKGFWSFSNVMKFFPRSLTKVFGNIKKVELHMAELERVAKEDLKEFGRKLEVLSLWGNEIERIDADLFEFNPNLKIIVLAFNKIKHIGNGAFNGLEKLQTLVISSNPCTSSEDYAIRDHSKVLEVIEKVEGSCKDLSLTTVKPELAETTEVEPETE